MAGSAFRTLDDAFGTLLSDLSTDWPVCDVAYVRDILAHAEYGEALENLLALADRNGVGFSPGQRRTVEALGRSIGMNAA
jgi:hypothetical protein